MSNQAQQSKKRWSFADLGYGLLLGALLYGITSPLDHPFISAVYGYALVHLVAGHGLFHGHRWGVSLSRILAFIGWIAGAGSLMVFAWLFSYVRGVHGAETVELMAVYISYLLLLILFLWVYPTVKLVYFPWSASAGLRRFQRFVAVFTLSIACGVPVATLGWASKSGTPDSTPIPQDARQLTMKYVRAVLMDIPRPDISRLSEYATVAGPIYVTVWHQGRILIRASAEGADLSRTLVQLGRALRAHPKVQGARVDYGRIKVDRVIAQVEIPFQWPSILSLSLIPGIDGLRRTHRNAQKTYLPDDLIKHGAFPRSASHPSLGFWRFGFASEAILQRLAMGGGQLYRLRMSNWLEGPKGRQPTVESHNTKHGIDGVTVKQAIALSGSFLLREWRQKTLFGGIFHYRGVRNAKPQRRDAFIAAAFARTFAEFYGQTGRDEFQDAAKQILFVLADEAVHNCRISEDRCMKRDGKLDAVGTVMTARAMLEFQLRTGELTHEDTIRSLLRFALLAQRADGGFEIPGSRALNTNAAGVRGLTGQTALALAEAIRLWGPTAYVEPLKRALAYLTETEPGFWAQRLRPVVTHYTCRAARVAWPHLRDKKYLIHCQDSLSAASTFQYGRGASTPDPLVGQFGLGALTVFESTDAMDIAHAAAATMTLGRHHGLSTPTSKSVLSLSRRGLMRQLITEEAAWSMPDPAMVVGGIRSPWFAPTVEPMHTRRALDVLMAVDHHFLGSE